MKAIVLVTALLIATSAQAQSRRTAEENRNLALVERAFAEWAAGRGSPFDLLSPDASWTIMGPTPSAGTYDRARLEREVLVPFTSRMATPLKPTVHRLYADGDTVIALFEASGRRKDGAAYRNAYAWFLKMRAGRIVEATAVLDLGAYDAVLKFPGR
jgi:uncharacterized protein